jgi:aspartate beta-hydroxylase
MSRPNVMQSDDIRVRELVESAMQAESRGQSQHAQQLLRQAEAVAPSHPLILNEIARRLLLSGNATGAYTALKQGMDANPSNASNPSLWINLAAALRGLGRPDEEMAALDKVLSIEPGNLRARLQKASLQELQGQPRAAAMTFRDALQLLPPGFQPPPPMEPVIQHAREAVHENDRRLEVFLEERLKEVRTRHSGAVLKRFEGCLDTMLQKRPVYRQKPSFMNFPGLPAIEFYERADFPWLDSIEAATADIRAELINVLADGPSILKPYIELAEGVPVSEWRELNHSRRWGVYFLWREGVAIREHIARCPRTAAALEAWPGCDIPGCGPTAVFSILDAGTRIPPHNGVNNTRLVVHLPLIVPPGCGFRVGAERREWLPGKAFVFDDTMEHEAWNDSDTPRAILILDIWSPFLTAAERDLVRSLTAGVGEWYGTGGYGVS